LKPKSHPTQPMLPKLLPTQSVAKIKLLPRLRLKLPAFRLRQATTHKAFDRCIQKAALLQDRAAFLCRRCTSS
jgi:hypothetical protein